MQDTDDSCCGQLKNEASESWTDHFIVNQSNITRKKTHEIRPGSGETSRSGDTGRWVF